MHGELVRQVYLYEMDAEESVRRDGPADGQGPGGHRPSAMNFLGVPLAWFAGRAVGG